MRLPRISPAWIVTTVLLVLATSTSAYAAGLAANSVGTKHLKNNAVVSTKVKDGTLRRTDFRPGTLLRGPAGPKGATGTQGVQGPQGEQGPQGPSGTPALRGWLGVQGNGVVLESDGVVGPVTRPSPGVYCIGSPFYDGDITGYVVTVAGGRTPELYHNSQACPGKLHVQTIHNGSPIDSYFTVTAL
ncbi:collagen-like protein [Nocardioides speluncae]|uniref:collagen-like protein n=1 Tax=Nocardioides speluncae TaxID=2670337 RepID=UPI000D68C550|nr:collagen-like protein [Nocardioides speluncae]